MPKISRYLTALLGVTGCMGLLFTGEINAVMAAGGLAIIPGYYRVLRGRDAAPAWVIGVASLLTLGVFVFDSIVSGDVFLSVAHLTITFQAIKSYDLREPWDNLQVYFMSLLQMVIASEMSQSLVFGAVFVLFLVLLVAAMVFAHFMKEGRMTDMRLARPIALISLLSIATTSAFFVALPRTSHSFLGKSHTKGIRTTGFSDKVEFGSFGEIKRNPAVVMRVALDPSIPGPYYWRGMSLDYFDGYEWRNTDLRRERIPWSDNEYVLAPHGPSGLVEQKIYLEAIDSDAIFGLSEMLGIRVDSYFARRDSGGAVFLSRKFSRRVNYIVLSRVSDSYPGNSSPRYLQLPPGSKRIAELAQTVAGRGRNGLEKAAVIEQYLKRNYSYSLEPASPGRGVRPIEDFLFYGKKGFCEHFATSMVLMLRAVGIPSRIVNGYCGGEENRYGEYLIVRQSDAHSWVEALIDGQWRRYDPTPSVAASQISSLALVFDSLEMAWARYVVGFRADDQRTALRAIYALLSSVPFSSAHWKQVRNFGLPLALAALVLGSMCLLVRRAKARRHGFATRRYLVLRRLVGGKNSRQEAITPGELRLLAGGSAAEKEIGEFLMMYEKDRFGKTQMSSPERKKFELLLKSIRKALRAREG